MRTLRLAVALLRLTWIQRKLRWRQRTRLRVPQDWRLTLVLVGVALGLLGLIVIEVAEPRKSSNFS